MQGLALALNSNRTDAYRAKSALLFGFLVTLSILALFFLDNFGYSGSTRGASAFENATRSRSLMTRSQRQARERYLASRLGLQYGIPTHAFRAGVSKMRAMAAARKAQHATSNSAFSASSPAVTTTWDLIGPQPMSEKANFTGVAIGANVPMTGRITSVAADAHGVIVAGAASGGLWVSTDDGGSFVSVFDNQPTQAIGAVALDTTTDPSTIYVGTGEGNGSIDSLYGAGIFKSANLG